MSFTLTEEELQTLRELARSGPILVRKPAPWEVPMRILSDTCDGIHPVFNQTYKRRITNERGETEEVDIR